MSADLDTAIDRAIHELMDAEPRADLRARVLERIDRPGASVGRSLPHRSRWRSTRRRRVLRPGVRWTWILAPIAAAAVAVLAIVLWQAKPPLPTRAVTQNVVRPAETRLPPSMPHREDRPNSPPRISNATKQDRRIVAAVVPDAAQPTIELEPLRAIEAISTPPVALQALDTQQIGPPPLAPLAQIEIEPVNSSAGRN